MKKTGYIIIALSGFLIATAYFVFDESKFSISEIEWGYDRGDFNVSFIILNDTRRELSNKLVIRAYKDKYIGKAIVTDLIGEKRVSDTLAAGEQKKVTEILNLSLRLLPDRVVVNAID